MKWLVIKILQHTFTSTQSPSNTEGDTKSAEPTLIDYAQLNDSQTEVAFQQADWKKLKQLSHGYKVVLMIPTEWVSFSTPNLPIANKKQLAKAIPFAMEESLAEDIDNLHFIHHHDAQKTLHVAAINKTMLQKCITQSTLRGLKPYAILADAFSLPLADERWTLSSHNQRSLLRQSAIKGHVFPSNLTAVLLASELEAATEKPNTLLVDNKALLASADLDEDITVNETDMMHAFCSPDIAQALPMNLMADFYTGDSSAFKEQMAYWRLPIACGLLAAAIGVGYFVIQNTKLENKLGLVNGQMTRIFKDTMPNGRVDSDYRVMTGQMREELGNLGSTEVKQTSALEYLATAASPLAKNKQVTLKKVNFQNNKLELSMSAKELTALENFSSSLKKSGFNIVISNSTSSANRVDAQITLQEATQ